MITSKKIEDALGSLPTGDDRLNILSFLFSRLDTLPKTFPYELDAPKDNIVTITWTTGFGHSMILTMTPNEEGFVLTCVEYDERSFQWLRNKTPFAPEDITYINRSLVSVNPFDSPENANAFAPMLDGMKKTMVDWIRDCTIRNR